MAEEQDRIDQIRERRSRDRVDPQPAQQQQVRERVARGPADAGRVGGVGAGAEGMLGTGAPSPWMHDRVTLSLEAQIAMIEMRANYRLTLADMGYRNRQQLTSVSPGVFLKVEPTGCYRMVYHNRM